MFRKALNTYLSPKFVHLPKSFRLPLVHHTSLANFSDSNEPPKGSSPFLKKEPTNKQAKFDSKPKDGFSKKGKKKEGRKEDSQEGGSPKNLESRDSKDHPQLFHPRKFEGKKSDKPKLFEGQEKRRLFQPKVSTTDEERLKGSEDKEVDAIDQDYLEVMEDRQSKGGRHEEADSETRREAFNRDDLRKDKKMQKMPRLFGRKELESGFVLNRLNVEFESEADAGATELTEENKKTIRTRIGSVRQLENTTKKFENLMEFYLMLDEPQNAQKVYLESQEVNIEKDIVIENFMFEACLKDSFSKAKEFYAYLKDQNKLEEIFFTNMGNYLEAQAEHDHFEELNNTLEDLKAVNFNISSLDISIFNKFLGLEDVTQKEEFTLNQSSKQNYNFLRKSEIFVNFLGEILRRKPAEMESFPYLFKFRLFFEILNHVNYPKIKLDSNGLDICMTYLETLAGSNLINSQLINFEDLAKWTAIYFDLPDSLRKIHKIVRGIPKDNEFFPYFMKEFNSYISNKGKLPFDAESVRDHYAFLKEEVEKSNRLLNIEPLRIIIEIAQAHKQYDIIFDVYENYTSLVRTKENPLFLYISLINSFTYMKLSTKNCSQIVNNLINEYTEEYKEFPRTLTPFLKIKSLIKDSKYEEAHTLFNNDILRDLIPMHQRTMLFSLLAFIYATEEETERRRPRDLSQDSMNNIKKFVNGLSDSDLHEMFRKLEDDNLIIYEVGGATDVDEHIKRWQSVRDDPTEYNKEIAELREKYQIEAQKIAKERINEYRISKKKGRLIDDGRVDEIDEEMRRKADPNQSDWNFVELGVTELNKEDVTSFLSRAFSFRDDIKKLMKLPLEGKSYRENLTLSSAREEYSKPLLDLINDLMLWGVYNNEPLAVQLGEQFYEIVGHKASSFLTRQIAQYYKYQFNGELDKKDNSFTYTQEFFKKSPKYFYNAQDTYTVVQDDPVYNAYVEGLRHHPATQGLYERLVRQQPIVKPKLLNLETDTSSESQKGSEQGKKPLKINFLN